MKWRNRVYPLQITTLTPLHVDSGTRLAEQVDFYSDNTTTYVLNSDVALDLALQRWEAERPSSEQLLRDWETGLDDAEERLQRRRERNIREIEQFDANPPRDPMKREKLEERLVAEARDIKARTQQLKERRATPPTAAEEGLPPELVQNSGFADLLKMGWLTPVDLHERTLLDGRALVRYACAGRPESNRGGNAEIYEQIKDVADRPYLPGSSLKGAIRSALAWDYYDRLPAAKQRPDLQHDKREADNPINTALFQGNLAGERKPNGVLRDVLRALHVGDSSATTALELLATQVYPKGVPISIEAIPAGADMQATLQVERYMFEHRDARQVLDFGEWQARLEPVALAASCRRRSAALIAGESDFFGNQVPELSRAYAELEQRLNTLDERSFLLPIGWGAGWRSKTLAERLRATPDREEAFVQTVQTFNLRKDKKRSYSFRAGDLFPATRKLVYQGSRPVQALGWVQVTIGEERE
jgi:CRISPR-associated protein Csm5